MATDDFNISNPTGNEFTVMQDFSVPEHAALFRRTFKDTALYRRFLRRYSPSERKELINGKYLGILSDYAAKNRKTGRQAPVAFASDEVWPAIQNWNGNLYHGSPAVILSLQMLSHPEWLPVFLTVDQSAAMGLTVRPKSGTIVVHRESIGTLPIASRVFNIAETDFPDKHPHHYAALKETFREMHRRDMAATTVTPADIDKAVQQTDRSFAFGLDGAAFSDITELAKCALVRMAAPKSNYYPSGVSESHYVSNLDYQSAYRLVRTAGRVVLGAEKSLGLAQGRGLDMDDFIRRTNKKFLSQARSQTETVTAGHRL